MTLSYSGTPNYSERFLYHIHLEVGKNFTIFIEDKLEVAALLPNTNVILNEAEFQAGEFVEFREQPDVDVQQRLSRVAEKCPVLKILREDINIAIELIR